MSQYARFLWISNVYYNKLLIKIIMKKQFLYILGILLFTAGFYSCDKIEPPYTNNQNPNDTTSAIKQMVYVEYFTGHRCVSCPTESARLKSLYNQYNDRLIYVSIHSGFFAAPLAGNFSADYRTTAGNDLDTYFGVTAISTPNALINRKSYESSHVISPGSWSSVIAQEILEVPKLKITLNANIQGGTVNVVADIQTLISLDDKHNFTVFIVEDSIQSYQKNNNPDIGPTPDITNYNHRFVLRQSMNGSFGESLFDGPTASNTNFNKQLSVSINAAWNVNKLYAICIVTNDATDVVVQAAKIKINP